MILRKTTARCLYQRSLPDAIEVLGPDRHTGQQRGKKKEFAHDKIINKLFFSSQRARSKGMSGYLILVFHI